MIRPTHFTKILFFLRFPSKSEGRFAFAVRGQMPLPRSRCEPVSAQAEKKYESSPNIVNNEYEVLSLKIGIFIIQTITKIKDDSHHLK